PRKALPRGPAYLPHVLHTLKQQRPDHFREQLRVSPTTFDRIVEALRGDLVFSNNSHNPQMAVDSQLAIALYRFGRNGNGVTVQDVANWAGVSVGTVILVTRRVMTAVLRPTFMQAAVRYPTPDEKKEAKKWVHQHSCRSWRHGGFSYFDRKSQYSLNVQIVSLPNLRIVDFAYGHTGSTHDATAWEQTRTAQNHADLLDENEFVWADSAYPVG
ncbi:hypothetical protein BDW22DRAFT_1455884, partial [Trametopsis cervina]